MYRIIQDAQDKFIPQVKRGWWIFGDWIGIDFELEMWSGYKFQKIHCAVPSILAAEKRIIEHKNLTKLIHERDKYPKIIKIIK